MNKLKLVKPLYYMEPGSVFEFKDGEYVCEIKNVDNTITDDGTDTSVEFSQRMSISEESAKNLIENGFLKELVSEDDSNFINVFDQIDKMLTMYKTELNNLDNDYEGSPACMKVEKETVLKNLIKALTYLKNLKR